MTDDFGIPKGPSTSFWFGADGSGRDLFVRVLYGARTSLLVAFVATSISMLIGIDGRHHRRLLPRLGRHADLAHRATSCSRCRSCCSRSASSASCGARPDGCLGGLIQPGLGLVIVVISAFTWPYIARIVRSTRSRCARRSSSRRRARSARATCASSSARSCPTSSRRSRLGDAADPEQHPLRGGALVPRARRARSTTASWGSALSEASDGGLYDAPVADDLPGHLPGAHHTGVQPARRRPARRTRPPSGPLNQRHCHPRAARRLTHCMHVADGPPPAPDQGGATREKPTIRGHCAGRGGGCELTIAATTASARPQQAGATQAKKAAAGGVFRVEWESSFDFTDGFDPTGEYLGEAFGIYSNLLVRTLVGYNHVAGARRQQARPRPRDRTPASIRTAARRTRSTSRTGIKFGPPVNRAVTSKDVLYAFQRIATPKRSAPSTASTTTSSRAWRRSRPARRRTISGIETPDLTDDHLHADERRRATSSTALAMPAAGPHPAGGRQVLHARPASTAATSSRPART